MAAYEPLPGTIAARAIPVLDALGAGQMLSSSELAERIGCDSNGLAAYLDSAVRCGRVKREKRERLVFWGKGEPAKSQPDRRATVPAPDHPWRADLKIPTFDGRVPKAKPSPAPPPAPAAASSPLEPLAPLEPISPPLEPLAPIEHTGRTSASFADLMEAAEEAADILVKDEIMGEPVATLKPEAPRAPAIFALWSDGRLEIRAGGCTVVLEAAETIALDGYMERCDKALPKGDGA